MKRLCFFFAPLALLLFSCSTRTVTQKDETGIFKMHYVDGRLVKTEHLTRSKKHISTTFSSRENCPDSVFFYDSLGHLESSDHFSRCGEDTPWRQATYWPNRHYKTVVEHSAFKTKAYTGVVIHYSEKGQELRRDTLRDGQ